MFLAFLNLGFNEIVLILIVALIVIGPKNLPKAARAIGRFMGQAQRMSNEFTSAINREANELERRADISKEATIVDAAPVDPKKSNQDGAGQLYDDLYDKREDEKKVLHDKPEVEPNNVDEGLSDQRDNADEGENN